MSKLISLTFILMMSVSSLFAQDLSLPKIFSDHMVLQRDTDVRFWGWADPGAEVSLQLGDINRITVADQDGQWEAYLPDQPAGGPHTITIKSGKTVTLNDVYFGDVWVAGGQSNMEWKLSWMVENWEEEIANSGDFPEIRFFEIPQATAPSPKHKFPGGEWKKAHPDNAGNFSAVAWYFAKLNHADKDVPVGIVESNWGGTPAEAWTPALRLLDVDGYKQAAKDVLDPALDWEQEIAENTARNERKFELVGNPQAGIEASVHKPEYNDDDWETVSLPTTEPLSDVAWLRRTFAVDAADVESVSLFTGDISQESFFYINGEQVGQKSWQNANETFDVDPGLLKTGTNHIAFRAVNSWNNQVNIGGNNNMSITINGEEMPLTGEWKYSNSIEPPMPQVSRYEWTPGFLYNAMIHPLAGYSIKGAIWYQGESNAGVHQYYNELFEAMIEEWRASWHQGDFPFLYVQLANYMQKREQPNDSDWARLREAQTQTLTLANTGMATIIDIGDANDIHPRNKHDVGARLWKAAQKVAYGEQMVYSGPMYRGHVVEGDKIRISLNHTGSGLITKGTDEVLGFAIAGADEKFHWAKAKIDGDDIVVWSDKVENPVAVRYAWADNPDVSLYNEEGLPAVPFRTDEW
ncbi:sialate O-acetylesterase [Gracilimonas mengyeensis]|uniref:Sialate O-acetylesterase n=1 Tax=Gracilimonas mengyeensis TaxID=1302730 RepID=A0A521CMD1_9BACT|nr:sialate O-acetylesterase [Gracilimonas mengyeensis]SMO60597.1 sialate O-acetylesterase [Gracilimonas mengyeensis]